jgi:hypothetical protein
LQEASFSLMGFSHGKSGLKSPAPYLKTPAPGESGFSHQLIREQLHKIVASRTFRQSKRLVRFLSFIVDRAFLRQEDQINEYLIGVEVYQRPASFDPQTDTIIRTEARRLRLKLQQYYDTEGCHDAILIDVPKGAYAPLFLHHRKDQNGYSPAQQPLSIPSRRLGQVRLMGFWIRGSWRRLDRARRNSPQIASRSL